MTNITGQHHTGYRSIDATPLGDAEKVTSGEAITFGGNGSKGARQPGMGTLGFYGADLGSDAPTQGRVPAFYTPGGHRRYSPDQLQMLLDACDGEIARLKYQESALGCWIETFGDYSYYIAIFVGLTIGAVRRTRWEAFYWIGGMAIAGSLITIPVPRT